LGEIVSSNAKSEEELLESYKKIRETYESFKSLRTKLGLPKRTIFSTEATKGDVQGKEFLEAVKQLKEKEKADVRGTST